MSQEVVPSSPDERPNAPISAEDIVLLEKLASESEVWPPNHEGLQAFRKNILHPHLQEKGLGYLVMDTSRGADVHEDEAVGPADRAIETLLQRKWPDYYAALETPDQTPENQDAAQEVDQVSLCNGLIQQLKTEVFDPFNPRVGAAIASSLQDALAILAPGAEYKYSGDTRKYQAFANYYLMLASLASEFGVIMPAESAAKYRVTPYPAELSGDMTHAFSDGSQLNTYHVPIRGDFGATELRDYDDDGQLIKRDFLQQPATLSIQARPGVRAAFSLSQRTSNRNYVSQDVEWRTKGSTQKFSDFSIRLDKDDTYGTGFSLDVGRDARDDDTMHRPGDVVGEALQAARPTYGSHFPEHFQDVTDADFNEFLSNLSKFLRADAETARMDMALRSRNDLNTNARWEHSKLWPTRRMQVVALTRGASGKPPFGVIPKADQK